MAIAAQNELLIRHYLELKQFEKVLSLLREALANDPSRGEWHYELARVYYQLNRYEDVEPHLQEALRLGYSPLEIYFLLGSYYQATKRYDQAHHAFEEALRGFPHNAVVLAAFAYLKRLMGKKKEAKRMIEEAMRMSPGSSQVLNYYVNIQLKQISKRKRMEAMQMRIQSGGSEKDKQVVMGIYETHRKRYHAAREHYRQAFLIDSKDRRVLNGLYRTNLYCHPLLLPWRLLDRLGGYYGGISLIVFLVIFSMLLSIYMDWEGMIGSLALLHIFLFTYVMIAKFVMYDLISYHEERNRANENLHG